MVLVLSEIHLALFSAVRPLEVRQRFKQQSCILHCTVAATFKGWGGTFVCREKAMISLSKQQHPYVLLNHSGQMKSSFTTSQQLEINKSRPEETSKHAEDNLLSATSSFSSILWMVCGAKGLMAAALPIHLTFLRELWSYLCATKEMFQNSLDIKQFGHQTTLGASLEGDVLHGSCVAP